MIRLKKVYNHRIIDMMKFSPASFLSSPPLSPHGSLHILFLILEVLLLIRFSSSRSIVIVFRIFIIFIILILLLLQILIWSCHGSICDLYLRIFDSLTVYVPPYPILLSPIPISISPYFQLDQPAH